MILNQLKHYLSTVTIMTTIGKFIFLFVNFVAASFLPTVFVEWLTPLLRIRKDHGSNLGRRLAILNYTCCGSPQSFQANPFILLYVV
jgi:hypothetical protein